jgi:hypothetical protein
MSKAEERALEKYPLMSNDDKEGLEALKYIGMECECASVFNEAQEAKQAYFIEGYHQAEKDLALTWEDIRDICRMWVESKTPFGVTGEALSIEVLNRFNKLKGK